MIYVTGDTHGEHGRFVRYYEFKDEPTAGDVIIVCGDFGYLYLNSEYENRFLDELEKKPYTICFVDGNHENFPAIYAYPLQRWNGGKVHRIRNNVYHLMRGQVFEIQGKKIFTFGGAYSRDRATRTLGYSYWDEELPTDREYNEAVSNLRSVNNCVDYIITHQAPREIILTMGHCPDVHDIELTGFLEWIMHEVKFEKWFFGHWHTDELVAGKFRALWFDVEKA